MAGGSLCLLHQGWHGRTLPSAREKRALLGEGEDASFAFSHGKMNENGGCWVLQQTQTGGKGLGEERGKAMVLLQASHQLYSPFCLSCPALTFFFFSSTFLKLLHPEELRSSISPSSTLLALGGCVTPGLAQDGRSTSQSSLPWSLLQIKCTQRAE